MSALAVSVLLSFVSALAYAGGAIVQEQVAVSSPDSGYLPLRRASWWGALALNGLGGVLHVVALAYGPLSLVQPLGALTIVFALPMAALFVGRKAGATAWRGALMATAGLSGLLSLVGSSDAHSLDGTQRVAVALVTGGVVVALMCAGLAAHRHPAVRSVLLATASGIAFGMSSVFTKTVAVDWSRDIGPSDLPSLGVIVVFAAAGVLLSQASYRGGGLAAPLATLTVVNPVLAAAVGILMFGETFRYGTTGTVLALSCGVVAAGGLIMLTTDRMEDARPTADRRTAAGVEDAPGPGTASTTATTATTATTEEPASPQPVPTAPVPAHAPQPVPTAPEPAHAPHAFLAVPPQRPAAEAETRTTGRPAPGVPDAETAEPVRTGETEPVQAGKTEPVRTGEPVLRDRGVGKWPVVLEPDLPETAGLEPVAGGPVAGGPVDGVPRQPGEAVLPGSAGPALREPAEPILRELLVPGADGGGDTEGGAPPADHELPVSCAALGIYVPLPVLDRRRRERVRS